jgi:hypothetical protein
VKHTWFPYNFLPLVYADNYDRVDLEQVFKEQGVEPSFPLVARRRHGSWITTLPPGVFLNEFRAGIVPDIRPSYEALLNASRTRVGTRGKPRRLLPRHHAPTDTPPHLFHHVEAVRVFRECATLKHPAFLNAMYNFLLRAEADRALIVPPRPRPPYDPANHDGQRGPAWTAAEDNVLRRWFGMHTFGEHKGKHVPLSPEQWELVFAALGGQRTRAAVQQRLCALNKITLREFLVAGFVPQTQLKAYMKRALGEKPRLPPVGGRRRAAPRPPPATYEEAAALLERLRSSAIPWSPLEDQTIADMLGVGPGRVPVPRGTADWPVLLAKLPGRTKTSIYRRAQHIRERGFAAPPLTSPAVEVHAP